MSEPENRVEVALTVFTDGEPFMVDMWVELKRHEVDDETVIAQNAEYLLDRLLAGRFHRMNVLRGAQA